MLRKISLLTVLVIFQFQGTALSAQDLCAVKTPDGIEISEGSAKVLFYQVQPKSQDGQYERANYVHPLYSLNGSILTEDFPSDHPHHHGIFWSWHQIIHNERPVADGWTSENISWEVIKSKTRRKRNAISLNNAVLWKSPLNGNPAGPIVRELSTITVHAAKEDYRMIDFDIHLLALQDSLKIGGSDDAKGYGGFSWRIKLPNDIRFVNRDAEVTPQVTAVQAGEWLDCVGSFDGSDQPQTGVVVFCHPSNPGHPQPWILRREKSMQNLAFPGRTPVKLTKKGLRLKYRMVIHNGNVQPTHIEKLFQEYKHP